MTRRSLLRRRRLPLTVLAIVALAGSTLAATASAGTNSAGADTHQTVTYHGYQVEVPADWKVIDLSEHPDTCVRFDRPVVYLGKAGNQNSCPTGLIGRTTALHIQRLTVDAVAAAPNVTASARTAPSADATIQVADETAGVLVTASHGEGSEPVVRQILRTARNTDPPDSRSLAELQDEAARDEAAQDEASGSDSAQADTSRFNATQAGPQPGTYTGEGFDACAAPSQGSMDAWLESPYQAVGVYISGSLRACDQPELTSTWVDTQTSNGWHLIPLDVGRQAPCTDYGSVISTDPATARVQGVEAANGSVAAAQDLGIPEGSAIYSDIEAYSTGGSCSVGVLSYISGWTDGLHDAGYLSGMYSSGGSGMADLVANHDNPDYTMPDHIHFAWWNGAADVDGGEYIPDDLWASQQRIHQYEGDHEESYGGVTINIDSNYLDVVEGTPDPPSECQTTNLDFESYPALQSGASGDEVRAAQCLLKSAGHYDVEPPTGEFDQTTSDGTSGFQAAVGLPESGEVDAATWTALLSAGSTPTVQNGSSGEAVSRLQRALTAAVGRTVGIDGIFGPDTEAAVREYQTSRNLDVDGIVGANTWGALQAGQ